MAEAGRVAVRDPGALLPDGFWAAVAVWLERPQVANKRLCGARLEARRSAALPRTGARGPRQSTGPEREERATEGHGPEEGRLLGQRPPEAGPGPRSSAGLEESQGRRHKGEDEREAAAAPLLAGAPGRPGEAGVGEGDLPAWDLDSLWDDFSRSLGGGSQDMLAFLTGSGAGSQSEAQHQLDVVLRTVIPKRNPLSALRREIVVQDVHNGTVTFLPLEEDDKGNVSVQLSNVYQIQLRHSEEQWFISVLIFCPERWHSDGIVYPKLTWLGEELLAKLARWAVESRKSEFKRTLSLVSIVKYSQVYQELKDKYKDMVKVWPEVTDPEKFVYEDVAIASYLLVLWEEERAERGVTAKQSFVDLGCGNGLLVHILSSEGHPGRGIDVRRRKIWDMYGPQTRLEEVAITPNDRTLFPDVDWLIGNHSDELTPWIPVIAARSSYSCRFFVLPCCFFDFVGKHCRRQSGKTQYRGYLDFISEVGRACGFRVEEDCLRIPSTRRVCLLGKSRTYPPAGEASVDAQRTRYINSRQGRAASRPSCPDEGPAPPPRGSTDQPGSHPGGCPDSRPDSQGAPDAGADGRWLSGFRPREKAERGRNCAALPREFVDGVVVQVAQRLLGGKRLDTGGSRSGTVGTWNRGAESLSLAEVAGELGGETLRRLKRECGGLQTLLRNNRQVFEESGTRFCVGSCLTWELAGGCWTQACLGPDTGCREWVTAAPCPGAWGSMSTSWLATGLLAAVIQGCPVISAHSPGLRNPKGPLFLTL
ncbi:probable tRNA (uracil-O(2)-)-methyltransferase isoform X3 [Pteropus alecto]|uniref:probable tRNA (uracil-O(2)-)-methyltransferase isoform X3 n=1 Tax=Pteropus alecto TaxID=9402 RepID=UPI0007687DF0|nr:probable tRNA (uracil-O(2)-)-methyltransferase isoform X3 [Pteropus alecto]